MTSQANRNVHEHVWWKEACVYQVYPASFKDSNGDGLGDIPGLISKIDYLESLGVDVVWLSPMFESPQADMGYDVSNYEAVHAPYGTVEDVDKLVHECHSRGMKLILDLVANHTSSEHAWFKESRSSKTNPKRDWYFWRPARYDKDGNRIPPSNYCSYFGGSTWEWDERTQEYYLHLYSKEQPDLNWDNGECRKAIYDSAMRFWLNRGVDGFRVDTVNKYSKYTDFPDAPITDPHSWIQAAPQFWCNGPRIHEFVKEMNTEVLDKYKTFDGGPVMTVGELSLCPDPEDVLKYVSASARELNMVFQADMMCLGHGAGFKNKYDFAPWKLPSMKAIIAKWQNFIEGTDGWTTVFNENHDSGRAVSRWGNDAPEWREKSAKLLALMLIVQTGTLFLYQGQEIGMINAPKEWPIEEYKDIDATSYYNDAVRLTESGVDPTRKERILNGIHIMARDHARLPMQWDGSTNAGFSSGEPWMRVHDLYKEINVEQQMKDADSVLKFYQKVLKLRKEHCDVLVYGAFQLLEQENENTFIFRKQFESRTALVALNFTDSAQPVALDKQKYRLLISTYKTAVPGRLHPYEGSVYLNY